MNTLCMESKVKIYKNEINLVQVEGLDLMMKRSWRLVSGATGTELSVCTIRKLYNTQLAYTDGSNIICCSAVDDSSNYQIYISSTIYMYLLISLLYRANLHTCP